MINKNIQPGQKKQHSYKKKKSVTSATKLNYAVSQIDANLVILNLYPCANSRHPAGTLYVSLPGHVNFQPGKLASP